MLSHFSHVWLFATPRTIAHQLLCPWDFPGKNTGVGYHSLLQRIFPTQGLNLHLLHCRKIFFFLGKRWIYLERNTLHRQGVGHLKGQVWPWEKHSRVWAVATAKPGNMTTEPVPWSLGSSNYWDHNPQLLKPTSPRAELHNKRGPHYENPYTTTREERHPSMWKPGPGIKGTGRVPSARFASGVIIICNLLHRSKLLLNIQLGNWGKQSQSSGHCDSSLPPPPGSLLPPGWMGPGESPSLTKEAL